MKKWILLCLSICSPLLGFEMAGAIGLRQDCLRWTIGIPKKGPNICSELNWKKIRSVNFALLAHQIVYRNIALNGSLNWGKIFSGTVWDRDWNGQEKTALYSISNSRANKGSLFDTELEVSAYWSLGKGVLSESSGFGYHRLHLSMIDGWDIYYPISNNAHPIKNLDSHYKAQFFGPYLGLGYTFPLYSLMAHLGYNYSFLQYRAKGFWNLRTEFADDFIHQCKKGFGHTFIIDGQYGFDEHWKAGLIFLGRYFKAYHGDDYTFFIEDGIKYASRINFNAVRWMDLSLYLYLTYQFGSVERRQSVRERLQRVFPRI